MTLLTREGPPPLAASAATALPLLTQPIVAVLLGAALGVASLLVSRASSRLVTPEDPMLGFAKLSLVSFTRMIVVLAALAAYFVLARPGFVPFAVTLVFSFLGTLGYEAWKVSSRTHRPARTS
jgi:hypothetical protein